MQILLLGLLKTITFKKEEKSEGKHKIEATKYLPDGKGKSKTAAVGCKSKIH